MGCKKISYHEKKISPLKVIWSEAHTNKARQENKKNTEFFDVDYYAFGMQMPGRSYTSADGYRYGFNGKEKDDEVKGNGNSYDFGARIYDPRLGRWLGVDPLTQKYPNLSPYVGIGNCPILFIDNDGQENIIYLYDLRLQNPKLSNPEKNAILAEMSVVASKSKL